MKCAIVRVQTPTFAVFVLVSSISDVGSGHSDHKCSVSSIDNFDWEALPGNELLARYYGMVAVE